MQVMTQYSTSVSCDQTDNDRGVCSFISPGWWILIAAACILYESCVRGVQVYGSETWAVKEEDIRRIGRADPSMFRGIGRIQLSLENILAYSPLEKLSVRID